MELIRDLLRDLVGIIFPGGLFVIITLWLIFGVLIILIPDDISNIYSIGDKSISFLVLLIFSYIVGQSVRIRQLENLEKACTETYRKRKIKAQPGLSNDEFQESISRIDKLEEEYYAGKTTQDQLAEIYKQHNNRFGIWEFFPYPYLLRGRRLLLHPSDYNQFFEKYDQQGITKHANFFNFIKTVVYEYSPSLKEELIRQEALVRLFAGIYYVMKYGTIVSIATMLLHLFILLTSNLFGFSFLSTTSYSWVFIMVSVLALVAIWYLNREILDRLRFMRMKELNLAYDGFYIICRKNKLEIG